MLANYTHLWHSQIEKVRSKNHLINHYGEEAASIDLIEDIWEPQRKSDKSTTKERRVVYHNVYRPKSFH